VGNDGSSVVELDSCSLLEPEVEAMALAVGQVLQGWPERAKVHSVEVCAAEGKGALLLEVAETADGAGLVDRLLAAVPVLAGAVINQAGHFRESGGDVTLPDGDGFIRPDAFAQANRAANAQLVARTLQLLAPRGEDRALELYCGDGNFTLPLSASAVSVSAVDREGKSLEILRRRARARGVGNLRLIDGDALEVLMRLRREGERFDIGLLDPPRVGAKALMDALAAVVSRRIAYVSCDPATLSRDVGLLRAHGFRLAALAMVDLFPQTYHLEAIAVLERSAP
jgi:23S rRNA (uracil1939-C5)-methyltransferase